MPQPNTLQAPKRGAISGTLADLLMKASNGIDQGSQGLEQAGLPDPLGILSTFMSLPEIAKTAQDISYGMPVTTGKGMTMALKPDASAALMTVAPFAKTAGVAAKAGAKSAARNLSPVANDLMQSYMNKVGATQYVLPPEKFRGLTLEGMPTNVLVDGRMDQFGTDQRLVDIARQYTADRGLPYLQQTQYAKVDPERAGRIASAYDAMPHNPYDPAVKRSFNALADETFAQYEALRRAGYKFDFLEDGVDKYGNPRNAINDLIVNKRMSVFPTESGFGTINEAADSNPLLSKTGEKWNGKDVLVNDMFRAVHDAFGHGKHGVGFRAAGEENAFQSHARMFSPEALPALTSETRGQNSWVNFGPHGKFNQTASPADTIYADQKTGLMPDFTWKEGLFFK